MFTRSIIFSYCSSNFLISSLSINVSILLLKEVIFLSKSLTLFDIVLKLIVLLFFITECISPPIFDKSPSIVCSSFIMWFTFCLYVLSSSIFFLVKSISFNDCNLVIDLLNSFILPSKPFKVSHICSLFLLKLSIESTIPFVLSSLFAISFTYLPFIFLFISPSNWFTFFIFNPIFEDNLFVFFILFFKILCNLSNLYP